jgi:nicotinamide mononucleotide adenylyltransferase
MVREESDRQMNADASIAAFEARRVELQDEMRQQADWLDTEQRAQRLYAEAVENYQKNDYAKAYQKVNEALAAVNNMKEAHVLKSSILQRASNASSRMSDKVAFWCAAYEAGQGYVDRKTQRHILSALKSHLFMTGLAGQVHSTRTPFSIRQRIWTVEELKEK